MQGSIAGAAGFEHVAVVDLRPLLSNALPGGYKKSWENELHPTEEGFDAVAGEFARVLGGLPVV